MALPLDRNVKQLADPTDLRAATPEGDSECRDVPPEPVFPIRAFLIGERSPVSEKKTLPCISDKPRIRCVFSNLKRIANEIILKSLINVLNLFFIKKIVQIQANI